MDDLLCFCQGLPWHIGRILDWMQEMPGSLLSRATIFYYFFLSFYRLVFIVI